MKGKIKQTTPWRSPSWLAIGHLANDWPIASLWLIIPSAGTAMHLSAAQIGTLFAIVNFGGALAYLPAGMLADRTQAIGRLLLATFWWVAIGYSLAAAAPDYRSVALLLAIAGMGNAAWHPMAAAALTRGTPNGRARALGIHAIGGSVAEILAPLSVGLLLAVVDWREALLISVVPTLMLGVAFFRVARLSPQLETTPFSGLDRRAFLQAWLSPAGLRLMFNMCLYNMALLGLLSMIPLFLGSRHSLDSIQVGFAFAAMLLVGAVVQPWIGSVSDSMGRRRVLVVGNAVAALASVVLIGQPSLLTTLGAMFLGVGALDSIRSVILAAAVDHSGQREGTTLGLAFSLMDGVGSLGAVLAGIAVGFSWSHMFGLVAVLALGSAVLSLAAEFRPSP